MSTEHHDSLPGMTPERLLRMDTDEIEMVVHGKTPLIEHGITPYPNPYFETKIMPEDAERWLQQVAQGNHWPTIKDCSLYLPMVWAMYRDSVITPREHKDEVIKDLEKAKAEFKKAAVTETHDLTVDGVKVAEAHTEMEPEPGERGNRDE